jgi:HNH endonuclease/NUMOD4 motif
MYETWRPIARFESYYEVSSLGNIRSIAQGQGRRTGRLLKCWLSPYGYRQVQLQVNKRNVSFLVHTLVADAFLGACPINKEVDHIDGNKANNIITNLRYLTRSENIEARNARLRAACLPLTSPQHGEHNPMAKLTEAQVSEIRRLHDEEGFAQRSIAEHFGVRRETIGKILRGERWRKS